MLFRSLLLTFTVAGSLIWSLESGNASRAVSKPIVTASEQLNNQSKLTFNSIGNVRVGMTVAEASKAAGIPLSSDGGGVPESGRCGYAVPQPGIEGLHFMLDGAAEEMSADAHRIVRIEVRGKSAIATSTGAKIGDTEARIKALYPGQIEVTPHQYYSKGHYLTVVPKASQDTAYRLIFETDADPSELGGANRVVAFHAGKLPEVQRVEGCF